MTWTPCAWRVANFPDRISEPTIESVAQIEGPDLFAVRWRGRCLNRCGEWEFEPIPSSRDDAFMKRCRFVSLEEAMTIAAIPVRILSGELRFTVSPMLAPMKDDPCRYSQAGWKPIATAPKDGSHILILFDSATVDVVRLCWWNNGSMEQNNGEPDPESVGWWSYKHSVTQEQINPERYAPIAWMPMPECPQSFYPYRR